VKSLTKDQIAKIFSGAITDWKDVGGTPGKIRVLIRESGASTRSAFEAYFFGGAKATYVSNAVEVTTIDETVKAINSFKESIGMVTMNATTFSNNTIAFATVDGVAASRENLNSGKYQVRRPLYFVYPTDATKIKPAIKAFLDYVRGPEGQKILAGL
jgi:phosphate transport system substrate-binding protein